MAQIPHVGKCFAKLEDFTDYLKTITFDGWRPKYIVMHHTGAPDLATWRSYGSRSITDERWMSNLASYYGNEQFGANGSKIKGAWSSGPHFFITPKNYCVLSLPEKPGTHAASFNRNSWGVECVGNFDGADRAEFVGTLRRFYTDGMAALHMRLNMRPDGFKKGSEGLHFHRDDPLTTKTCPGTAVKKQEMVAEILKAMTALGGAGPEPVPPKNEPKGSDQIMDKVRPLQPKPGPGEVIRVPDNDVLFVRASASAKSPIISELKNGAAVDIIGEAKNGTSLWYEINIAGDSGWVNSHYIERD